MKRAKKILAVLLTMAMALSMTATAFASQVTAPDKGTTARAEVRNVEAGATVTAYQIVSANYTTEGFRNYYAVNDAVKNILLSATAEDNVVSAGDLTIEKTTQIAQGIVANTIVGLTTKTLSAGTGNDATTYSAQLPAGSWVVIVNASNKVYNPMLLSLYYTKAEDASSLSGGSLDATGKYFLADETVYAKSSDAPIFKKEIVGGDNSATGVGKGSSASWNQTISYKIEAGIPPYDTTAYQTVTVKISDKLSPGLDLKQDTILVALSSNATQSIGAQNYTLTPDTDGHGFTVELKSEYALQHTGETVVVKYDATLNKSASVNFDPNTNTATYEYSNSPDSSAQPGKETSKTYTYTFAIGAKLWGDADSETQIIKKTGEEITTGGKHAPLANATFELRKGNNVISSCTTGEDGNLEFSGLAAGEYTLVEKEAPEGYSLTEKEYKVVISATYTTDGQLDTYKIFIGDKDATDTNPQYVYKATYSEGNLTDVKPEDGKNTDPTEIPNTKLSSLPSTGGIGTTIFTVVGCIVMIGAAGLFFASRRKTSAK